MRKHVAPQSIVSGWWKKGNVSVKKESII